VLFRVSEQIDSARDQETHQPQPDCGVDAIWPIKTNLCLKKARLDRLSIGDVLLIQRPAFQQSRGNAFEKHGKRVSTG
jgi:16S rRNA U1498 N3-methylase RsmE